MSTLSGLPYIIKLPYYIFSAVYVVIEYVIRKSILRIPVSYPGDPIRKPLTRKGKWSSQLRVLSSVWKFAEGSTSHEITNSRSIFALTGKAEGRQIWYQDNDNSEKQDFEFKASKNPNSGDKIFRKIMVDKRKKTKCDSEASVDASNSPKEAAKNALRFYEMLQCDDGHFAGDYGGPMFLMPGLICVLYLTKCLGTDLFPQYKVDAMIIYLRNHQQLDGGWGTHIECASTMFGSVLSYVALRLLGVPADENYMKDALVFIHKYGGALYAPSWAKFWLATLGVYDWKGINSIPAEMWLLPRWFPFHPGKLWCHCRMVYLPMCYIYCKRFTPELDDTLLSLRKELYLEDYYTVKWDCTRQWCADIDEYSPLNPVMKLAQDFLSIYERVLPNVSFLRKLRKCGIDFAINYIHEEDAQTNYVDIGPVNKCLNMLSVWIEANGDITSEAFQRHIARVDDYLWVAEDGMKMQGYNGSQCWDTAFALQAILESNLHVQFPEVVLRAYNYLKQTQISKNESNHEYFYRHISKGGWPFSTSAHGWPITGLKAVLLTHRVVLKLPPIESLTEDKFNLVKDSEISIPSTLLTISPVSEENLKDACNVILSFQNADYGWATYENNRGYGWYEMLNPSEVFGDIMIDYSYVECSSACITALKSFLTSIPEYKTNQILNAIKGGVEFIKSIQRSDGSWYGSWGNCFLYGTWFGIEGLIAGGEDSNSLNIRIAVEFILSKQNPNGGWGESYFACVNKSYPIDGTGIDGFGEDGSGIVQTAWALLSLLVADCKNKQAIDRGIHYLMKKQKSDGDWEQEGITGVFNRSCGITYTAYRNVFPLWALTRYVNKYDL